MGKIWRGTRSGKINILKIYKINYEKGYKRFEREFYLKEQANCIKNFEGKLSSEGAARKAKYLQDKAVKGR